MLRHASHLYDSLCDRESSLSPTIAPVPFDDVLAANAAYADRFSLGGLAASAGRGLAVVTCMDSRIEPLTMLGLRPGDAKILRNGGARVTDDIVKTLVLARYLLGVDRVMVVAHTDCRLASGTEEQIHEALDAAGAPDSSSMRFGADPDQHATLSADVAKLRAVEHLAGVEVGGFLYDVESGRITPAGR